MCGLLHSLLGFVAEWSIPLGILLLFVALLWLSLAYPPPAP